MNFFEAATLRLKQQLKVTEDKQVAEALGMTGSAWTKRKTRHAFPEMELYALAAKRPDLGLDVDYVLTGITAASRGLNDAARGRVERASKAGLGFEDLRALAKAQGHGPGSARMAQLQTMLPKLRATEFEGVFELVQSIVGLREALENTVQTDAGAGEGGDRAQQVAQSPSIGTVHGQVVQGNQHNDKELNFTSNFGVEPAPRK